VDRKKGDSGGTEERGGWVLNMKILWII